MRFAAITVLMVIAVTSLPGCQTPQGSYTVDVDNALAVCAMLSEMAESGAVLTQQAMVLYEEWELLEQRLEAAEEPSEADRIREEIRALALEVLRSRVLSEGNGSPKGLGAEAE
ncbi:MAG: hypothetical protein GWP08_21400 [Nitrospiraceae bacterium]|nr:hypothetical protein [Nitrospiraceae bacterium]